MPNETMFEKCGRLFFSREKIKELEGRINAAGINLPADSFAGYTTINIIVATAFLSAIILLHKPTMETITTGADKIFPIPSFLISLAIIFGSLLAAYLITMTLISSYLLMKTDDRRNKLEVALPDFLSLVASNIKAGMTLDQAMWYSAKPEFGLLSKEVIQAIKGAFSGETLEAALDKLASRFDSRTFKRTILLIKQASSTGGELTNILERTAEDVRNSLIMKKDIAASLVLYEIFVLVAAVIGTPFLFSVATKIIGIFEKIAPQVSAANTGQLANAPVGGLLTVVSRFRFASPIISSSEFFWFSLPIILVTSLISSFIVSVIRTGSRNQGMKYFPLILIAAYIIYWLVSIAIDSAFATII